MARIFKKDRVLEILQKTKETGVSCDALKEIVTSDDKGIMRSLKSLKKQGHDIQFYMNNGEQFVKLSLPQVSVKDIQKYARNSKVSQKVLSVISTKEPMSVQDLCTELKIRKQQVFTAIHCLRKKHKIDTVDGKYIYKSEKGTTATKEPPEAANEIVLGKITQRDLKRIPTSMMGNFTDSLWKLVFYHEVVKVYINATQTVDKFVGNTAE